MKYLKVVAKKPSHACMDTEDDQKHGLSLCFPSEYYSSTNAPVFVSKYAQELSSFVRDFLQLLRWSLPDDS
jgi:hypothetical protein